MGKRTDGCVYVPPKVDSVNMHRFGRSQRSFPTEALTPLSQDIGNTRAELPASNNVWPALKALRPASLLRHPLWSVQPPWLPDRVLDSSLPSHCILEPSHSCERFFASLTFTPSSATSPPRPWSTSC